MTLSSESGQESAAPMAAGGAAAGLVAGPDGISVRGWFALYGLLLLAAGAPLAALAARQPGDWSEWLRRPGELLPAAAPGLKLLAFGIYLSLCCTFLPLPANWIVAAVAMRQAAVGPDVWSTTVLVAVVGAAASTVANLNDYHLFTWMLRGRRIGQVRMTRAYRTAARWFARSPFFLVAVFNVIPIPVDVVRMVATTCRYGRVPFAAASFLGRLIRYATIAFVTYRLGSRGNWAVLALLAAAVVLGLARVLPRAARKLLARPANQGRGWLSDTWEREP